MIINNKFKMKKGLTAHEKILIFMYLNKRKFISNRDLIKLTGSLFIGYEVSARMAEVSDEYREFMRFSEDGRFKLYKMQWAMLQRQRPETYKRIQELSRVI